MRVDLAIIGGGINGCGIARDAAGRGLSVYLCEQNDLASGTSNWSTKLIHGGLRYLEHFEFRLVREALIEREKLWAIAPHIIRPLRFVLPVYPGLRPAWLLRAGLFLYDTLGGRNLLPATRTLRLASDEAGAPLKPLARLAFEYSDCAVDDARLVVLNAMDARDKGAIIEPHHKVIHAERRDALWQITVEDRSTGTTKQIEARALINAAGPWVADVLSNTIKVESADRVRLVQGSHLVVRRLFSHERAYFFQNPDGRIIFAIPYQTDFTLIGTTDRDYAGDPAMVQATEPEISYLLDAASDYFKTPLTKADIVWAYSGVRPLYDDGASKAQEATRDYVLKLDCPAGHAPLLSIFGGKITTYRRLALAALADLRPWFPSLAQRTEWTAAAALPGGDFPVTGVARLCASLADAYPAFDKPYLDRLVGLYGTRARHILGEARRFDDLGAHFGATLTVREVDYLVREEFARDADDILWRRTKLGLVMTKAECAALDRYLRRG